MNKTELVKLMLDYNKDRVDGKFSKEDSMDVIRQELIEANGGSTKLSIKTMRNNTELFAIIEELVTRIVNDGLKGNEFFMNYVDSKNLAMGDKPEFVIKENSYLVVSDAARGNAGIRRQRIGEKTTKTLTPTVHVVKVYEHLSRILAGNADINELINEVSKSVTKQMMDDVYAAWNGITSATLGSTYYKSGVYSEDTLLDLVDHVSAANDGVPCTILTTLKCARKLTTAVSSDLQKDDFYNFGYPMKWNGITLNVVPQRHKVGTTDFIFDDDKIYVIPQNIDRMIKQVRSGEMLMIEKNAIQNMDLTQEYGIITEWTTAIVCGVDFGVYEIA